MRARIGRWLAGLLLFGTGCAADAESHPCTNPNGCAFVVELNCAPGSPACRTRELATFTTQPGEEVLGKCQSWTLDNPEPLYVNSVELEQNEASHHSDWTFVPQDHFAGPDGVWPCEERDYEIFSAASVGGILFAQSTQVNKEQQRFPPGVAIRIPPHSRLIGDVHLYNPGKAPVTGNMRLTLRLLRESEVRVKLTSFHASYDALSLPALSPSRFTGNCSIAKELTAALGAPPAMHVYYVLPHAHDLVTHAFARVLGGPNDGRMLLDLQQYDGTGNGRMLDPPMDMTGADGFTFGCDYLNTREQRVDWGFVGGEMCELFGFADLPLFFHTRVTAAPQNGMVDGMPEFVGSCSFESFPPPE